MKKTVSLLFSLFLTLWGAHAQNPCGIVITGSFDSECLYEMKTGVGDEYPEVMVACKGAQVTYTAFTGLGDVVASYLWSIVGDASHSASGNHVTVDWGTGDWGIVMASVVTMDGDTCTWAVRVNLIDIPTADAVTIPAYTVTSSGAKVIRVCKGTDIQFFDRSEVGNSDIAGCLWQSRVYPDAATENYTLENVSATGIVTHRVYNNCGCYDDETFEIEILDGWPLELDCYGTACENSEVNYHHINHNPPCNDYLWYVEGGTLVDGQGTDHLTVVWDQATEGYGVIGLDGTLCGGHACPMMMSLKVPVIHGGIAIEGQSEVCIGEAVEYSLPLFGSTEYDWSITPTAGMTIDESLSNRTTVVFSQPGTYSLRCSYHCSFLDCGPYEAKELTITVKPKLEIEGWDRICVTNACSLQTVPAVNASWTAYDLGSNNAVAATATGTSFAHTFGHAGRYLVTASHSAYCGPATFVLTVRDTPSAPTAANLDPANSHTACPGLGIALSGTPSEPDYTLVWEPVCTTASPQWYSGDSVTIGYQAEVCDVRVYNYDRRLQCLSANAYVHTVAPLTPAPLNIPQNITVCPGSLIVWGQNEVPDQSADGMLYEWTLEPTKQYCASVQGSHLMPSITLLVNKLNSLPATFYIKLTRTFCGGASVDTTISITVTDSSSAVLSIAGPDTVCAGETASFAGIGGNAETYVWTAEGSQQSASTSFSHSFSHNGVQTVTLSAMPGYTYCTNPDYRTTDSRQVYVVLPPILQEVCYDIISQRFSVEPPLSPANYIFEWTLYPDDPLLSPQNLGNTPTVVYTVDGIYSCTVTDRATGCSSIVTNVSSMFWGCDSMVINSDDFNYCEHTIHITAPDNDDVSWSVSGGGYLISTSGDNHHIADIIVDDIGIYIISAKEGQPCLYGRHVLSIDFLPEFEFVPHCGAVEIKNTSRYTLPAKTVYLKVTNSCNNNVEYVSLPVTQQNYTYEPGPVSGSNCTYFFYLCGYGVNNNIDECLIGEATIGEISFPPNFNPVSITLLNPYNSHVTCDNTPVELTATSNYITANPVLYFWNFSDGSTYKTGNDHVFHTFGYPGQSPYNVTVTIKDDHGCFVQSKPFVITSNANDLQDGLLTYSSELKCPFVETTYLSFQPSDPTNHYTWSTPVVNDPPPHPTHHSGNYSVLVVKDNFCHKEASLFVKFKNAPTARITADNLNCCVGENLVLNGAVGPSSDNTDYQWTIVGPNGYYQTATTPSVTFPAPQTGSYAVTLTVTNLTTLCSATAHETVTVNLQPPAPTIVFTGSPCIADVPVGIAATGFIGEMHWSNGSMGATADYNYPGPVWAYYFDPSIGCPSAMAELHIDEQPDFDALLTGCYEKCKFFMPYELPVYGFPNQTLGWNWTLNNTSIATGSGIYSFSPLMLPLQGFGSYQLEADNGGVLCSETSPLLNISQVETCTCDSLDFQIIKRTQVSDCPLVFIIDMTVCNNSCTETFCFQGLNVLPGQDSVFILLYNDFAGATLMPGQCRAFTIHVKVVSLHPSVARFRLNSTCEACFENLIIDLMPKVDCSRSMYRFNFSPNVLLSNPAVAYFDFSAIFPSTPFTLLDFWSEPPMVVDYHATTTGVHGLGMIDVATLTQLVDNRENICVHALVCDNGVLCELSYCFSARILYDELVAMGILRNREVSGESEKAVPQETSRLDDPILKPNPTTGEVDIVGADGTVVEVVVMDMMGKPVATIVNNPHLDLSTLVSGSYIARVRIQKDDNAESVSYLKLVKK